MKILHTSDWHIGKRAGDYNLQEDQEHMLDEIVSIAEAEEGLSAIVISGDVYDRSVPSAEAVMLLDRYLVRLARLGKPIFIISGNHDSAERLAFASRLLQTTNIYLSPVYDGNIEPVILKEGDEEYAFYLLPFIKPIIVQHYCEDGVEIKSYNDAMRYVVDRMQPDSRRRNILLAHQYITGSERTDSEDTVIGGLDNVDAEMIKDFDYVALGHLHRAQSCGCEHIRYSGTPMKYSFSEVNDKKSVTIVTFCKDKPVQITTRDIVPLHEWYDLCGTYEQLMSKAYYDTIDGVQEAFVRITLTDEEDIYDAYRRLKSVYHHLVEMRYDNHRTRKTINDLKAPLAVEKKSSLDLFRDLYQSQNNAELTPEQEAYLQTLIEKAFTNTETL